MIYIGNHVSIAKGYLNMAKEEYELGGNTFAFFTRNPRGGKEKNINIDDIDNMNKFMKEHGFHKLVAHLPYTMNLCSTKEDIREYSRSVLEEDLKLMELIPGNYMNFHPGSALGQDFETAKKYIVDALNSVITEEQKTTILLETMAGKGTEVGRTFEEIASIINDVRLKDKIGVCLDTCHVFDGGYDIVNNLDKVLDEFNKTISLSKLKAIHLNDSKNLLGSHKDRHEKLGEGNIGIEAIKRIIQNKRLQNLPFILETPNDNDGYKKEIAFVKANMI